jgi:bile acid:Na+ symporter, BASS family
VARIGFLLEQRLISVIMLAIGIVAGLAFPTLARVFQPFALHALFLVVVFSLVPFARLRNADLLVIDQGTIRIVAWQQLVVPAIVVAGGILARFSENVILLLVVTACSSSLFASPALAQIMGLDRQRTLQCLLLSTLAMPVSLYMFLSFLKGASVDLDLLEYARRIVIFLGCPLAIFALYRLAANRIPIGRRTRLEDSARCATIVSLIVFGVGMMYPVSELLHINPQQVVFYLLLSVFLSFAMFMLTTIVMHRYGLHEALTGAILCGFRNVGLVFALVGDMTGPEIKVYIGVLMLPIFIGPFIIQVLLTGTDSTRARTP